MGFVLELLFQVVFEVVAYGVGRAVLLVVAPRSGVEGLTEPPKRPWYWRGFSFMRGGKRYFYNEFVQVIGLAIIVLFILPALLANYLK